MVAALLAAAVDRLAVLGAQDVDVTVLGQALHGPVDGGQADARPAGPEHLVQLLGAAELVDVLEEVEDLGALPRLTRDHDHRRRPSFLRLVPTITRPGPRSRRIEGPVEGAEVSPGRRA